jgi:hypothetical protein
MPLAGQASGGWTESSSALRILHVGIRNTVGILTDDAFTQTNPPIITTASTVSDNVDTSVLGILSGSVAIARNDQGANFIGGPGSTTVVAATGGGVLGAADATGLSGNTVHPLGLFINNAAGNAFENQPAAASGKGPYVSAMGTYASQLFETQSLVAIGALAQGDDLPYATGIPLIASLNGYLMPRVVWTSAAVASNDLVTTALQSAARNSAGVSTNIAILKMPADSVQNEIVFDQKI